MEKNDIPHILSSLQEFGLVESEIIKVVNTQTNDRDVLYWKILAFLVGTQTIKQNLGVAKKLLEGIPEDDEPRFQMLRGLLAMADSNGSDICLLQRAEACFLKASSEPTKEVWYCLGVCRYKLVNAKCDFNIEIGFRRSEDSNPVKEFSNSVKRIRALYSTGGAETIRECRTLLKSSYRNLYDAYQLGSIDALVEIAKCIEADSRFGLLVRVARVVNVNPMPINRMPMATEINLRFEFRHPCDCYRIAAVKGLAEGWKLLHHISLSKCTSEPPPSSHVDEKVILEAWISRRNISQAYYFSQMYNQADALPHYIAGVVFECGLCGLDPNRTAALREFEKALESESDVIGFVKELAKDHLTHMGYLKGYLSDFGYEDDLFRGEILKYLEYEIERSKNDCVASDWRLEKLGLGKHESIERERMMRRFRWWYALKYVLVHFPGSNLNKSRYFNERPEKVDMQNRERLAQILLDSSSPDGLFIMSALRLYEMPLNIKANAKRDNELDWLRFSTIYGGGSSDGNYWIARSLLREKRGLSRLGRLTASEENAYNAEIVRRIEMAAMWGHMAAEFNILMAARYGGIDGDYLGISKSPEEIANGFLRLRNRGCKEAGYEYAFCQYDQFGVTCDVKDCYDWIRAAAYVYHGYGRGRAIYNKIWSYPTCWEDIDRGCQEI